MKVLIYMFIILMSVSCASKKVYKTLDTDKVFNPYYENWKLNTPMATEYLKGVEREIPIYFSYTQPTVTGHCQLNPDINERKIFVNKKVWDTWPDRREKLISNLLSICYSYRRGQEVYYDYQYRGLYK